MICPMCGGKRTVYHPFVHEIKLVQCPMCDGRGEIVHTNFDRITDSPEKLAEFIEDVTYRCYGCKVIFADNCPHTRRGKVMFCEKDDCLEWLNEESDA